MFLTIFTRDFKYVHHVSLFYFVFEISKDNLTVLVHNVS